MKLSALLQELEIIESKGDLNREVSGICYDSRKADKDFVFVCIVGFETDGHSYIETAVEKGATVIVAQEGAKSFSVPEHVTVLVAKNTRIALATLGQAFYGHPERRLKIIGVTGTNGKTTVTTLIKSILEFEGKRVGLIGTNANMICETVLPAERTTPESLELYALFAKMAEENVEYVVMEVSSHSLALHRVHGITFAVGAFTNLTQDHLDFHKTMDDYFAAKKQLFDHCVCGVTNCDDEAGKTLTQNAPCPMITYSLEGEADFKATALRMSARGVIFDVCHQETTHTVRLGIPGRFSVYNALTALGAVTAAGVPLARAIEALTFAKGVMGRCETVYTKTDYAVIIDYAHTPDGLENIVNTVKEFTEGGVITLFGCGGDRDKTKRPVMGEIAGTRSDFVIVTSDNPRTEDPHAIIQDILPGVLKSGCPYKVVENRKDAIAYALSVAKRGDSIILAGKGHETYQIIGKTKNHFDEREVVAECLKAQKQTEVQ